MKNHNLHANIIDLPLESLVPSPYRIKHCENSCELAPLARSIQIYGLLEPLVVRQIGSVYRIISGLRRWYALRLLGQPTAPCVIADMSEAGEAKVALTANVTQKALRLSELADVAVSLRLSGLTDSDVAELLGVPIAEAKEIMVTPRLAPAMREALDRSLLPLSLAASMSDYPPGLQEAVLLLLPELGAFGAVEAVRPLLDRQTYSPLQRSGPLTPRERNRNRLRSYLQKRCCEDASMAVRIARQGLEAIWNAPDLAALWNAAALAGNYTCSRCVLRGLHPRHSEYRCQEARMSQTTCMLYVDPGDDYLMLASGGDSEAADAFVTAGELWIPFASGVGEARAGESSGWLSRRFSGIRSEFMLYQALQMHRDMFIAHPLAQPCANCRHYRCSPIADELDLMLDHDCEIVQQVAALSMNITVLQRRDGKIIPRCQKFAPKEMPFAQPLAGCMAYPLAMAILRLHGQGLAPGYWDGLTAPPDGLAQALAWLALAEAEIKLGPVMLPDWEGGAFEEFSCKALEQIFPASKRRETIA